MLKHQSKEADKAVAATKSRIALKNYARDLNLPKTGCDLDLLNPERTHFLSTRGHRIADAGFSDWTELHCILFDHYLVSTKLRSDRSYKYSVSRRVSSIFSNSG